MSETTREDDSRLGPDFDLGYRSGVAVTRAWYERKPRRVDLPGGIEHRMAEYATAIPGGRADDLMIHLTTPDGTYLGTLTLGWFREHTSLYMGERALIHGDERDDVGDAED